MQRNLFQGTQTEVGKFWILHYFSRLDITISNGRISTTLCDKHEDILIYVCQTFIATFHHPVFIGRWCPRSFVLPIYIYTYIHIHIYIYTYIHTYTIYTYIHISIFRSIYLSISLYNHLSLHGVSLVLPNLQMTIQYYFTCKKR